MKSLIVVFSIFFFHLSLSQAQERRLTLDEAIAISLANNFDIRISKHNIDIAKNNDNIGNAGFLPALDLKGSVDNRDISSKTVSNEGVSSKADHKGTLSLGLNASLEWILFDGFQMFIQKDKLGLLKKQTETAARVTLENVISQMIVTYSSIIQNTNKVKVLQEAIDFSNKRRELSLRKFQIGSDSELAYLQSVVDLNADSAAFINQLMILKNAKAELNKLMVNDVNDDFQVIDTIVFELLPDFKTLISNLSSANSIITMANENSQIALLNQRLTNTPKYPEISFYTDYGFDRTKYNFGTTDSYKYYGSTTGISLSYSLFNGFNQRRKSANAIIETNISNLQLQQITREIEAQIFQLFNQYQTNIKLVHFETQNLKISRQNTYIAFEKFRLGEMSDIDLRQIQLMQVTAENRLLLAQYQAKQVETELLRITGRLLQKNNL